MFQKLNCALECGLYVIKTKIKTKIIQMFG